MDASPEVADTPYGRAKEPTALTPEPTVTAAFRTVLALGCFAVALVLVVVLLMLRRQATPDLHMSATEAGTWPSPTPDPATGCLTPDDQAILFTANGVIRGRSLHVGRNLSVRAFVGVPYATYVGRFIRAEPQSRFDYGYVDAISRAPPCIQVGALGVPSSIDCLHLNVWTPPTCRHTEKSNRTVIVALIQDWFRTTRFALSPSWRELAAGEDVVVVVPSHRMGLLGFLNTGIQGIPGNVGLFDLLLALQWIKENAAEFGGDADSVVALGQGSGAAMLTLALRSLGRGFFKRVVIQDMSPFSLMPRNDRHVGEQRALRLCRLLGCHVHAGDVASLYLQRSYSEATLLSYSEAIEEIWFVPSFDQEPLIFPPEKLVDETGLDGVDLLCGVDGRAAEVLFRHHLLPLLKTEDGLTEKDETRVVAKLLMFFVKEITKEFEDSLPRLIEQIKTHYGSITDNGYAALKEFFEDLVFRCPMMQFADAVASAGSGSAFYFVGTTNDTHSLLLSASQIAHFIKSGKAPRLPGGQHWAPYTNVSRYTVHLPDGAPAEPKQERCKVGRRVHEYFWSVYGTGFITSSPATASRHQHA